MLARYLLIGGAAGALSLTLLLFPAHTPVVPLLATVPPVVAGALAAVVTARRERHEIDVDEAARVGAIAGVAGGFVLSVPFPVAMHLFVGAHAMRAPFVFAGALATMLVALVLLFAFLAFAIAASVIAARIAAR